MTGQGSNFIREIAEAYAALEREPGHIAEAKRLAEQHIRDGEHIAKLEMRGQDREARIAELEARIRSLEVERDDASFRELEAHDSLAALKRLVGAFSTDVGAALKAMEPPAPEPKPEEVQPPTPSQVPAEQEVVHAEGQSVAGEPVASDHTTDGSSSQSASLPNAEPVAVTSSEGQSAPLPTAQEAVMVTGESAGTTGAMPTENASPQSTTEPSQPIVKGPYSGLRYVDYPAYVSRANWLAGGGTEADYDYRPTSPGYSGHGH